MTTADPASQQSTVEAPSKKGGETNVSFKPQKSSGLQYYEGYPKAIRKTIQPSPNSPKEEVDPLYDFAMPDDNSALVIGNKDSQNPTPDPGDVLNDLIADGKAPKYWFNTMVEKHGYEKTLWFILNLKATLLNSANANLLKEWRLSDKVPPQDVEEVRAIASLYEKKIGNEKIIDMNTKAIRDYVGDDEKTEERKEVIINIALGNLGGLYLPLVKRDKEGKKEKQEAT
jgi:hypothetical protein